MFDFEYAYLDLLWKCRRDGEKRQDRTGTGTRAIFMESIEIDLKLGFPLLRSKYIHFHSVKHELLWMLSGSTNTKYLTDNKVRIWNEWADENGDLGPVYGAQWRNWDGRVDQISQVIESLKKDPHSRRHVVVAYNPGDVDRMALPPCHMFFQFFRTEHGLSCQMYQRSADIFLGVPFNIASYALLTEMIAAEIGIRADRLKINFGDLHLYDNHRDQSLIQVQRCPIQVISNFPLPTLVLAKKPVLKMTGDDISIINYQHMGKLPGKVSV